LAPATLEDKTNSMCIRKNETEREREREREREHTVRNEKEVGEN
jgi:hypothetical protein